MSLTATLKRFSRRSKRGPFARLVVASCFAGILALGGVWIYAGNYGLHVLFRHGGTYWITIAPESERLSASMRLVLAGTTVATPGPFEWRSLHDGFEVGDLPAIAGDAVVDHVLVARIDPAQFRFEVLNSSSGDKNLDQWMAQLGASLVINGSYYAQDGEPDTPFLSNGVPLGPKDYDAKAGAFVVTRKFTGVRDLAVTDWHVAFRDASNAMVSYPLLLANGTTHVTRASRWLANRSFVGQDAMGRIIIGTTTDAFFSLDRLATFLLHNPLGLTMALNLDGGPVASQGISLNGFERRTYGRWEAQVEGDKVELLTWPYGTVAMPIVLAVFPR